MVYTAYLLEEVKKNVRIEGKKVASNQAVDVRFQLSAAGSKVNQPLQHHQGKRQARTTTFIFHNYPYLFQIYEGCLLMKFKSEYMKMFRKVLHQASY